MLILCEFTRSISNVLREPSARVCIDLFIYLFIPRDYYFIVSIDISETILCHTIQ